MPPGISTNIQTLLAQARLASGTGDLGAANWLRKLEPSEDDKAFGTALAALLRVVEAEKFSESHADAARALLEKYPAENVRRYGIGAVLVRYLAGRPDGKAALALSAQLIGDLAGAEAKLPAGDFGATVAPAMIRFYRGEALRKAGQPADALVEYQTVLSVYPYNEWPDAAAFGVAACFEALGDSATARNRYEEIVKSSGKSPESLAWRALAEKRLEALKKGE